MDLKLVYLDEDATQSGFVLPQRYFFLISLLPLQSGKQSDQQGRQIEGFVFTDIVLDKIHGVCELVPNSIFRSSQKFGDLFS